MAAAEFHVTDPGAPARAAAPGIHQRAEMLRADAAEGTPVRTGRLRSGWRMVREGDSGRVVNDVEYARFIEFGTRRNRPAAMLGMALARARSQQ